MTPEVIADIERLVRAGLHPERAALSLGIPPSSMRSHRARHAAFDLALKRAEAVAEASALVAIQRAATAGDPRPAQWFLERRYPARWARPEIRAGLEVHAVNTDELVAGIHKGLKILATRHANFAEPDAEDTGRERELWRAAIGMVPGFAPLMAPPANSVTIAAPLPGATPPDEYPD